jgi:hypothetical protein
MNATIIDLRTERLARRGVRAGVVSSAAEMAGTCRVLVFDRRGARAPHAQRAAVSTPSSRTPSMGPGRGADLTR